MDKLVVHGGSTLRGSINISGSKNASLPILAAALLTSEDCITIIESAAAEPEVLDLANFLNAMGAKLTGAGTRRIVIEGVKELHGYEHIEEKLLMLGANVERVKDR